MTRATSSPAGVELPTLLTPLNLLPGPVALHQSVWDAFVQPPLSHRSDTFRELLRDVQCDLCTLTHASHVQVMMGSGTLANDAIAAQLAHTKNTGLVLSNGEFGERLCDAATRAGVPFHALRFAWGEPFALEQVETVLRTEHPHWLWAAHCETSTGMLNPLAELRHLCHAYKVELCLDCISSIGTTPLDLSDVWFASASSGKALGSLSGLGVVFYRNKIASSPTLPRALDLGFYAECDGVPFTQSSNLMAALRVAVKRGLNGEQLRTNAACAAWLRSALKSFGFVIVAPDAHNSSAVITVALPQEFLSREIGKRLAGAGYLVATESDYLQKRNWMQFCLMGEIHQEQLSALPNVLCEFCPVSRTANML